MAQTVLCHAATVLLRELRERDPKILSPAKFVQQLVASRYTPLSNPRISFAENEAVTSKDAVATALAEADQVLDTVLPQFHELRAAILEHYRSKGEHACADYTDSVVEIVAAHLLELWTVQLVGAANVGLVLSRCFPDGNDQ